MCDYSAIHLQKIFFLRSIASRLPPLFGYSLLSLFVVSCGCRLFFYLLLSRSFREVRAAHEVSIHELFFSVVGIRPLVGRVRD